jgi:CMP-N-acetylneuraminic acid synthetase
VKRHGYDSLGLVVPQREHLLNDQFQPQGFEFGHGHKPSQELPVQYRMNFSVSIVDREAFATAESYHVLKNPFWYHVTGPSVDIDTMDDFKAAQALYAAGV